MHTVFAPDGMRIACKVEGSGRLQVLPGQQHNAMDTKPDLFVEAVVEFLHSSADLFKETPR